MPQQEKRNASRIRNQVLFIGNGINNLTNEESWENLLNNLRQKVGKLNDPQDLISQFPLVFENLLNYGIRNGRITNENELKEIVAKSVSQIKPNAIHDRIRDMQPRNIITANYDFVLEDGLDVKNSSIIDETRFSIFRRFSYRDRNFWHIHGDSSNPRTVNLGFEHYSGQLQYLRNYLVSGTRYNSKDLPNEPFVKRLTSSPPVPLSWVDLLFTKDIHIVGLCLDFIEIDIWWLLTYRSKLIGQKKKDVRNRIYYYIPQKYSELSKGKMELLKNMSVRVITIDEEGFDYYNKVLDFVEGKQ